MAPAGHLRPVGHVRHPLPPDVHWRRVQGGGVVVPEGPGRSDSARRRRPRPRRRPRATAGGPGSRPRSGPSRALAAAHPVGVEAGHGSPARLVGARAPGRGTPTGWPGGEDAVQPPADGGQGIRQDVLGQDVGERQAVALEELPPQMVGVRAERAGVGRPHGRGSCRVGHPHCPSKSPLGLSCSHPASWGIGRTIRPIDRVIAASQSGRVEPNQPRNWGVGRSPTGELPEGYTRHIRPAQWTERRSALQCPTCTGRRWAGDPAGNRHPIVGSCPVTGNRVVGACSGPGPTSDGSRSRQTIAEGPVHTRCAVLPRGSAVRPDRLVATTGRPGRIGAVGYDLAVGPVSCGEERHQERWWINRAAQHAASEVRRRGRAPEHGRRPTEERVKEWKTGSVPSDLRCNPARDDTRAAG